MDLCAVSMFELEQALSGDDVSCRPIEKIPNGLFLLKKFESDYKKENK
jgi:hypothetical protein